MSRCKSFFIVIHLWCYACSTAAVWVRLLLLVANLSLSWFICRAVPAEHHGVAAGRSVVRLVTGSKPLFVLLTQTLGELLTANKPKELWPRGVASGEFVCPRKKRCRWRNNKMSSEREFRSSKSYDRQLCRQLNIYMRFDTSGSRFSIPCKSVLFLETEQKRVLNQVNKKEAEFKHVSGKKLNRNSARYSLMCWVIVRLFRGSGHQQSI